MTDKTCILFFSRSPEVEKDFKKISTSNRRSTLLIHRLYNHCLKIIKQSGLPYICYNEKYQCGGTFGEKFTHAIEETFLRYDNIITVGNDCPTLTTEDILLANKGFENNIETIGSTKQGGVYLLGLQKNRWDKQKYLNISWNTSSVSKQISSLSKDSGKTKDLIIKSEINTCDDIRLIINLSYNHTFLSELINLSSLQHYWIHQLPIKSNSEIQTYIFFRGPPSSFAA